LYELGFTRFQAGRQEVNLRINQNEKGLTNREPQFFPIFPFKIESGCR
jgi:hypothetical protein